MQEIMTILGIPAFQIADNLEGFIVLTVFTVLAQCGAGMAILKAIIPHSSKHVKSGFQLWALVAGILVLVGMGVSMLHLNDPMRAPFALLNPLESWLSMEIYAVAVFGFTLLLCLFSKKYVLRLLSGLAGAFMVFAMAKVYVQTSSITWSTINTYVTFFSTALLLGAVALLFISLITHKKKMRVLTGILPKLILLFLVARMVAVALLVLRSERMGVAANVPLMDLHISLTILGAGFILVCMMQSAMKSMLRLMHGAIKISHDEPNTKAKKSSEKAEAKKTVQKEDVAQKEQSAQLAESLAESLAERLEEKRVENIAENLDEQIDAPIEVKDLDVENLETENAILESSTEEAKELAEQVYEVNAIADEINEENADEDGSDKNAHPKKACNHYLKMPKVSFAGFLMFILVLTGELAGRFMFYLLYSNTGL